MNLSGYAVQELVERGHFELSQCVIIYDEVSLPLGKARIRPSGGSSGQKGMQSVLDVLGAQQIPRLRIGIAGDSMRNDLTRYVLDRFGRDELVAVEEVLDRCYSALEVFVSEGIDRAMTLYN
jgi:PTH1 family peptidyl-tRNA hydrolase